ncbi:MAG: dihydrolipoamide acetyltransferase family protein [Gammaproteobacteria bacterium]
MSNAIQPVAMPKMGIEMVEGTIAGWRKSVGESVAAGDEVVEIESDKIINVWESPVAGVLRRHLAEDGEVLKVGALLGVIAAAEVADAEIDAFIAAFGGPRELSAVAPAATAAAAAPSAAVASTPRAAADAGAGEDGARRVSPVVRRLAEELGVDIERVQGSGRNGRITTEDVERAAREGTTAVAPAASAATEERVALSATRKTIARRLTEAKQQIPHYYLDTEYELDGLLAHRKRLNAEGGARVSVNDLMIWCVARALLREPRVNITFDGETVTRHAHAHVSVAIATDDSLYAATIRNADTLDPAAIGAAAAALADRARRGALEREDITGGSFTVSNLGMFGVTRFTAIINPPMGAILALGKAEPRPVVREGVVRVATMLNATLSCDHRVIDGAVGARFLEVLGEEIAALARAG